MADLTHLDDQGRARMVDVGGKEITRRIAIASGRVRTRPDVIDLIRDKAIGKGDVIAVARVAGIMAAKKTAELIPLCHPIPIDAVEIEIELDKYWIDIRAEARNMARTGLEMEALTAVSVAALTIYDMCKAVDKAMTIETIRLEEKSGGKSGKFRRKD